jgi:hypothetical protein
MGRAGGGDAAGVTAAFAALRECTPNIGVRAKAPLETPNLGPIQVQAIAESDVQTLSGLPGVSPVDETATMVISIAIADRQRLYLERLAPAPAGESGRNDTGWFVGPAQVGANPFVTTVPVKDVLAIRPEWSALLSLPTGSLVIIDSGAIGAVLDSGNQDLWAEASMKKLLSSDETPSEVKS